MPADAASVDAGALVPCKTRPEFISDADNWYGVLDPKERKKIQDRLAQRARRKRLAEASRPRDGMKRSSNKAQSKEGLGQLPFFSDDPVERSMQLRALIEDLQRARKHYVEARNHFYPLVILPASIEVPVERTRDLAEEEETDDSTASSSNENVAEGRQASEPSSCLAASESQLQLSPSKSARSMTIGPLSFSAPMTSSKQPSSSSSFSSSSSPTSSDPILTTFCSPDFLCDLPSNYASFLEETKHTSPFTAILQAVQSSTARADVFFLTVPLVSVYLALWYNGLSMGIACCPTRTSHVSNPSHNEPSSSVPRDLRPTTSQTSIRHMTWIDRFPSARFRDNMIRYTLSGAVDADEFMTDLFMMPKSFYIVAGKSCADARSWRLGEEFAEKWGYTFL